MSDHPVRKRLIQVVSARLGINETRLGKEVGIKRSSVRHHLRLLVEKGILKRHPVGRENHYFPRDTDPALIGPLAVISHGRAKRVLREVLLDPGISQTELAELSCMTPKVLRSYLRFLGDHGLVAEHVVSRVHHYFPGVAVDEAVWERVLRTPAAWTPAARGDPPSRPEPPFGVPGHLPRRQE